MAPASETIVQHIVCKSAKEFLDLLAPRGTLFGTHQRYEKEWAFRGHGDDRYTLVPVALRNQQREKLFQLAGCPLPTARDNSSQVTAEVHVLKRFMDNCEERGLVVPGYGMALDHVLDWNIQRILCNSEHLGNWPHRELLPALCLAQHHGLPTRLLDWSYSSYKAAYFAASDSLEKDEKDKPPSFSVWAIRLSALKRLTPISIVNHHDRVDVVTPPRCDNAYLNAQEGLFTLCRVNAFDGTETVDSRSLEQQIEGFKNEPPYGITVFPVFYHLTLETTEAVNCLRGLEKESITAATLFPDYGGVAKAMRHSIGLYRPMS